MGKRLCGVTAYWCFFFRFWVLFVHQSEHCWRGRRWGHVDGISVDPDVASCRGFCSVPGPLQSVQRAEMWGSHLGFAVLSCGSLWCFIILVLFDMLGVCLMVVMALFLLNLLMTVIPLVD